MTDQPLSVRFRAKISAARQDKADAAMAEARAYKEAEKAGLHAKALKAAVALWQDDPSKSSTYLRHFDRYVDEFGLRDQTDLPFDQPRTEVLLSLGGAKAKRRAQSPSEDDGPSAA